MRAKVFYPTCRYLDPNARDADGNFYCEKRTRYVYPAVSVYTRRVIWRNPYYKLVFHPDRCAPNCWHRDGKTRVPTL